MLNLLKSRLIRVSCSLLFSFWLGLAPAIAFVDCSVEECKNVDCRTDDCIKEQVDVQFQNSSEPVATTQFLNAGTYLAGRSIELTAPLYLFLMTAGMFKRFILARL
jgi:hypothetical protein